jgi:hypothetical protein
MNLNRANLFFRLSLIWLALVASGFTVMPFRSFEPALHFNSLPSKEEV